MQRRVYVRFDDDSQLDKIDSIAESLRAQGLQITEVSPVVGQITGTLDDAHLEQVQRSAASFGSRLISEEDDAGHRLPDPESELQ